MKDTTRTIPALSDEECRRLLPMLRAHITRGFFGPKIRVLRATEESLLSARVRDQDTLLLDDIPPQVLYARKESPFSEISRVDLYRGGLRTRTAALRITSANSFNCLLPHDDTENLVRFLQKRLGDKLHVHSRVKLHGHGISLVVLLTLATAAVLTFGMRDGYLPGFMMAIVSLPLLLVQIHDHIAARFPWEVPLKKPKAARDRSGVKPFRSRFLGWPIKVASAAALLVMWFLGFGWISAIPCLLLLYFGHVLTQTPPKLISEGEQRKPILYLRSFLDDRKNSLMPMSHSAIIMGVQPPQYLPSPWCYILMFNPVRVLRVLLGWAVDTSEEQLSLFFRKHGPVIAIGKPGETFATPGASRVYVTNDEWQNVVLEYLESSQVVLLQPAATEGVWWEVKQALTKVEPRKVLFCMLNFHKKQNDYEGFRLRAEPFLPHALPRNVAYSRTPTFVYFDKEWRPRLQQVSCKSPFVWPWVGEPVDLNYTLAPFLHSASASQTESGGGAAAATPADTLPRPPRGINSVLQSSGALAYVLLLVAAGTVSKFVSTARQEAEATNQHVSSDTPPFVPALTPNIDTSPLTTPGQADDSPRLLEIKTLAERHIESSDYQQAVEELTKAVVDNSADEEVYKIRGDALEVLGRREEAVQDYLKAVEMNPEYVLAWNNLGYAYCQMGRHQESIVPYTKAIEIAPQAANLVANRGLAYVALGQDDAAMEDFTRSLTLDPQQAPVYYLKGELLSKKRHWVDALRHFNTALRLDPELTDAYYQRAAIYMANGDQKTADFNPYEMARQNLDEVLKRQPDNLDIQFERAKVNQLDGRYEESVTEATQLLEKQPENPNILTLRAETYFEAGKLEEALSDFDTLQRLVPNNAGIQLARASTLMSMKRFEEGLAVTDEVLKEAPDSPSAHQVRGTFLYRLARYTDALDALTEVLKLQPQNLATRTLRAQTYANLGQYDLARAEYQNVHDAQPGGFDPPLFVAYALAELGKWEEFGQRLAALNEAFSTNPSPLVSSYLVRLSLRRAVALHVDLTEQVPMAEQLYESTNHSWDAAQLLGMVKLTLGDAESAEPLFEEALRGATEPIARAGVQVWLARSHGELGKLEEAGNTLREAKTWITENCAAVVTEGTKIPECGQWWQRTELHAWLAKAEAVLKEKQAGGGSPKTE